MAYAVNLVPDDAAIAAVERLWHALAEHHIAHDMLALNYPPHLTLCITDDDVDVADAMAALDLAASRCTLPPVRYGGVGLFLSVSPHVAWLAPSMPAELADLHRHFCETLGWSVRQHYRPAEWVPHTTLTIKLDADRLADAIPVLAAEFVPFTARFKRLELVRFRPVEVLHSVVLAAK